MPRLPACNLTKGQTRSHLPLFPRPQPLCFAVARIFTGCVTCPRTRRDIRRKIDSSLSSSSRDIPGRWRFCWAVPKILLSLCAYKWLYCRRRIHFVFFRRQLPPPRGKNGAVCRMKARTNSGKRGRFYTGFCKQQFFARNPLACFRPPG